MDCNDARLLLHFARPLSTELEESEAEALATHLNRCADCADRQRAARRLDEHLGRALRDVPIPDGLQNRLKARLNRERDQWYRKRLLTWGAAAAVLFLAVSLGWNALRPRPEAVNLEVVKDQANQEFRTPANVEGWYRERKVVMKAPTQFDYDFLVQCAVVEFQGKRVPMLQFQKGNPGSNDNVAWVYVLTDSQFDLNSLEGKQTSSFGTFKVHWERDPTDAHVAYVYVYTGDLAMFKKAVTRT
jgi:hypothetical protein